MFKNIFPNKLNRLVYMGAPKGEVAALMETEKRKPGASPEDLKKEQAELNRAIDKYVKDVEKDINSTRFEPENQLLSIDLNNPNSYKDAPEFYRELLNAISRLKGDLNSFDVNERNLDYVHRQLRAYHAINASMRAVGDPFMHTAELNRVAKARPKDANETKDAAKKRVATPEELENARWIQIAKLADEIANMRVEDSDKKPVPKLVEQRAALQNQLKDLLVTAMKGKGNKFLKTNPDGYVVAVTRAPGAGTPAFMVELGHSHESKINVAADQPVTGQGKAANRPRGPRASGSWVTQVVYAGGSAKDFPKKS